MIIGRPFSPCGPGKAAADGVWLNTKHGLLIVEYTVAVQRVSGAEDIYNNLRITHVTCIETEDAYS